MRAGQGLGTTGTCGKRLTRFCRRFAILVNYGQFIQSHPPVKILDRGGILQRPHQLELHLVSAFLAFWELLALEKGNLVRQSVRRVADSINSTLWYGVPSAECSPMHWGEV
jgi:hypothetical protein